jgi:hypothetical protein
VLSDLSTALFPAFDDMNGPGIIGVLLGLLEDTGHDSTIAK